jgi:hypothetical protein
MVGTSRVRRGTRRLERWVLGIGMTMAAWIIERRLLKAIREGGSRPPADPTRNSGRVSVARASTDDDA